MGHHQKKIEELEIVSKELYDSNHLYFELKAEKPFPQILPGQFVQVLIKKNSDVFLRRPLSVHDWDEEKGILSLWIKVIGKGTASLSELTPGEKLNLIYPLGNTFKIPENVDGVLLVGGGCGAAPLLFLARHLNVFGIRPWILLGARSSNEFLHAEKYLPLGNVHFMTEDGSKGNRGFVTHHPLLNENIKNIHHIVACGPDAMMKAVGKTAGNHQIPCQVSLEHMMACGIGACLCCVVETDNGNVCTCTDGPVFFTHQLKNWF